MFQNGIKTIKKEYMKKVLIVTLTAVFVSLALQSCKQKKEIEIVLPALLKSPAQEDWAVIQEPYTAFYDDPDINSGIAAHARRGDVLQVKGRKIDDDRQIWIKFDHGWIPSSVVIIYSNELKARKAASNIEN